MAKRYRIAEALIAERNMLELMAGKIRITNFPSDAKLLRMYPKGWLTFALVIESEIFQRVSEGQEPPHFPLQYVEVQKGKTLEELNMLSSVYKSPNCRCELTPPETVPDPAVVTAIAKLREKYPEGFPPLKYEVVQTFSGFKVPPQGSPFPSQAQPGKEMTDSPDSPAALALERQGERGSEFEEMTPTEQRYWEISPEPMEIRGIDPASGAPFILQTWEMCHLCSPIVHNPNKEEIKTACMDPTFIAKEHIDKVCENMKVMDLKVPESKTSALEEFLGIPMR